MTLAQEKRSLALAIKPLYDLGKDDVSWAGGKGANLGELISLGLSVPSGFVVGAPVYHFFKNGSYLADSLSDRLEELDIENSIELNEAATDCRRMILGEKMPDELRIAIASQYKKLFNFSLPARVAVRSSATLEDSEDASFAGIHESYLNLVGERKVINAVIKCWASLFTSRSLYYRISRGMESSEIDIAVIVQEQIDAKASGVLFTVDPVSEDKNKMVLEGAWGLGEALVSGEVLPDRFVLQKDDLSIQEKYISNKREKIIEDSRGGTKHEVVQLEKRRSSVLSEEKIQELALAGQEIEKHFALPQDIEWALDKNDKIWIIQTRPITTLHSGGVKKRREHKVLLKGIGVAPGVGSGRVRILSDAGQELEDGEVLVAKMTSPDWVPLMRRASAVLTDSGGVTCHAAIVSRELGIPCIVGLEKATTVLQNSQQVTADSRHGRVYSGLDVVKDLDKKPEGSIPKTRTKILLNLSEPSQINYARALAPDGVGLLRAEFMITEILDGEHPRIFIERGQSDELTRRLTSSLQQFADAFRGKPVLYRTMDFKSNEFRSLRCGSRFEPEESNPMIGYRGAFRYSKERDLFRVEVKAVAQAWEEGANNIHIMIPFLRRPDELKICLEVIDEFSLRTNNGFELWAMAEVPSVLFYLPTYQEMGVDGVSIGSNDLSQLLLAADRDSELLEGVLDERDPAVLEYISLILRKAKELRLATSFCGQAPALYSEYSEFLVKEGINSISVTPDVLGAVRQRVAQAEASLKGLKR